MLRLALCALLLLPACAVPGDAAWSDLHANAFGGVYMTGVRGDANLTSTAPAVDGQLDFDKETESNLYYGVRAGFAPVELIFSGFAHESTHGGTFSGNLTGTNFSAAARATTKLDFDSQRLAIGFDAINLPVARIGLILGVDFFTFNEFSFTAREGGNVASYSIADNEDVPVPIVGVRGDVGLPLTGLRAGAEISGFKADVEDVEAEFLDADVHLGWAPAGNEWFELLVGYRMIDFQFDGELDDTNVDGQIEMDGLYFALGIIF